MCASSTFIIMFTLYLLYSSYYSSYLLLMLILHRYSFILYIYTKGILQYIRNLDVTEIYS